MKPFGLERRNKNLTENFGGNIAKRCWLESEKGWWGYNTEVAGTVTTSASAQKIKL
jgi:hypothetical protein